MNKNVAVGIGIVIAISAIAFGASSIGNVSESSGTDNSFETSSDPDVSDVPTPEGKRITVTLNDGVSMDDQ